MHVVRLPGSVAAGLALVIALVEPAPSYARPRHPLLTSFRQAWAAHRSMRALEQAVAANPGDADCRARLQRGRQIDQARRAAFWSRIKRTPAVQVLAGIALDGPRDTLEHVRHHPIKTAAIIAGAAAVTTVTGALGVPVDLIALAASGALTAKAVASKVGEVRQAFRNKRPSRWRTFGEDVLYPELAFSAGLAASAAAEAGVAALERAVPAFRAPAVALGAKSTAQLLDDLVPIASTLDGRKPKRRHLPR